MHTRVPARGSTRDLITIFFVAVAVALLSTLAGSVLDHVHQVNAEDLDAIEVPTTAVGSSQILAIKAWGVQLTLPLGPDLPLVRYADQGGGSIGLSAADLEQLSPACSASRNALGTLIRYPIGGFAKHPHSTSIEYFIGTAGKYEFSYRLPQGLCQDSAQVGQRINRETSAINASLGTLSALNN